MIAERAEGDDTQKHRERAAWLLQQGDDADATDSATAADIAENIGAELRETGMDTRPGAFSHAVILMKHLYDRRAQGLPACEPEMREIFER